MTDRNAEQADFGGRLKAAIDAVVAAKVPIPGSDESLFEIETMDALRTLLMSKAKVILALVNAAERVQASRGFGTRNVMPELRAALEALSRD